MTGTEDGRPQVRKYRPPFWLAIPFAALVFVFSAALVTALAFFLVLADAPLGIDLGAGIVFGGIAVALLVLVFGMLRRLTVVDQDHVTVRWVRTRRTAWHDILDIRIEQTRLDGRPIREVVLYDRDSRRIVLPNLVRRGRSVDEEVRAIRETWEQRRGEEWTPEPAVTEGAKAKSEAGKRVAETVTAAMGCGLVAVRLLAFGVAVVGLIVIATGTNESVPDIPGWVFVAVIGGVGLAPLAILLLGTLRRGRGRGR
jgi:hypothetical protein